MRFSLSWLKEYFSTKASSLEIDQALQQLGIEVEEHTQDEELSITITPNLAHCSSLFGIARELRALLPGTLHVPEQDATAPHPGTLVIHNTTAACSGYAYALIQGRGESPPWMQSYLRVAGIQPKCFAVDITQYVALELGHPLHVYDADSIDLQHIEIRLAQPEEKIRLLDGVERVLSSQDLVIASRSPIALAGIMGGYESQVTERTTRILVEACLFDPTQIRRTAKRQRLITDASKRFERGVDPQGCEQALRRALYLFLCYGEYMIAALQCNIHIPPLRTLSVSIHKIHQWLGITVGCGEVESFLTSLGFAVRVQGEELSITVPSYRHDIRTDVDLIEEVGRIYGFDEIFESPHPVCYRSSSVLPHPRFTLIEQVRSFLLTQGLQEWVTCNLIHPQWASKIDLADDPHLIHLKNPRVIDYSVLRTSLMSNLLAIVQWNQRYGTSSLAGFEIGCVHRKDQEVFHEILVVSVLVTGWIGEGWNGTKRIRDFYDLKGIIERLTQHLGIEIQYIPSSFTCLHPGQQASLFHDQEEVGIVGQIHPSLVQQVDGLHPVFFAELTLEPLVTRGLKEPQMAPISAYPEVFRDWTISLPIDYPYQALWDACQSSISELKSIALLDVYVDKKLGSELKNVTLRFEYRSLHRTLAVAEVETIHQRVVMDAQEKLRNKL